MAVEILPLGSRMSFLTTRAFYRLFAGLFETRVFEVLDVCPLIEYPCR